MLSDNECKCGQHTPKTKQHTFKTKRQIAEETVLRIRGSYDVPWFEACVQAELAEMG